MAHDTLDIDILVSSRAPELEENEFARPAMNFDQQISGMILTCTLRGLNLHGWIEFDTDDAPVPLNKEFSMWCKDIFSWSIFCILSGRI